MGRSTGTQNRKSRCRGASKRTSFREVIPQLILEVPVLRAQRYRGQPRHDLQSCVAGSPEAAEMHSEGRQPRYAESCEAGEASSSLVGTARLSVWSMRCRYITWVPRGRLTRLWLVCLLVCFMPLGFSLSAATLATLSGSLASRCLRTSMPPISARRGSKNHPETATKSVRPAHLNSPGLPFYLLLTESLLSSCTRLQLAPVRGPLQFLSLQRGRTEALRAANDEVPDAPLLA